VNALMARLAVAHVVVVIAGELLRAAGLELGIDAPLTETVSECRAMPLDRERGHRRQGGPLALSKLRGDGLSLLVGIKTLQPTS
jgi:hypothetical protein